MYFHSEKFKDTGASYEGVYILCYIALSASIFSLSCFFLNIKKSHLNTFLSSERGKDLTLKQFLVSNNEATKALVFIKSPRHWKSIEDKVEKWVRKNWDRWHDEKPSWFDENVKSVIPKHMIPQSEDDRSIGNDNSTTKAHQRSVSPTKVCKVVPSDERSTTADESRTSGESPCEEREKC